MTDFGPVRYGRSLLENGLVCLVSDNTRIPLVSINAFVLAGSDQNPMDRSGLASITARLLDEGTRRFEHRQIAEIVEGTGGGLSIFSHRELTAVSLQLKAADLSTGLLLLAEMLRYPTFPMERFELERQKVLNHLRSLRDDPQTVGVQLFSRCIYPDSPLGFPILGTLEGVRALRLQEVREFHGRKYSPENTKLVIVGDVSPAETALQVAEHFSDWRNPHFERTRPPRPERQKTPILRRHVMDREQVHIYLGHLGISRDDTDFYVLQMLDVIVGSGPGFTSRIPRRLRDEQGLAYATFSDITGSSGLYPGRFMAYISTTAEQRNQALQGLLQELNLLLDEGVTDEEVETAHDYLTGSFLFDFQSNVNIARCLLAMELFDLGPGYPQRYGEIIRSITRSRIEQVARSRLDTLNYTLVVVGPEDEEFAE